MACAALADVGISIEIVQTYAQKFTLPRSRGGKCSDLYFKAELVTTDHVRHFASDVLGMVPIMHAFLQEKIKIKVCMVRGTTSQINGCVWICSARAHPAFPNCLNIWL